MISTDDNIKRTFKQMLDAAVYAFAAPQPKSWAFGAAISFVTTTLVLTNQLRLAKRLPPVVEVAQKKVIAEIVSSGKLIVTPLHTTARKKADPDSANYNHLRNCFSHGNWKYNPAQISVKSMTITLEDWDSRTKKQTWAATMQTPDLIKMAVKLIVVTVGGMP